VLDKTFISEEGLAALITCINLRVLRMNSCLNIYNRQTANEQLVPAIKEMTFLEEVQISDTRVSGRSLNLSSSKQLKVH
jgi:hypothetical protein